MKLRLKLPLAMGIAILLTAGAGTLGIIELNGAAARYAKVIDVDDENTRLTNQALIQFKTQVQDWKDTLLRGKDAGKLDKYWTAFQKDEAEVGATMSKLLAALPEGEVRATAEQFAKAHATMGERYRKGFEAFKAADFASAAGDAAVAGMDRVPSALLGQVADKIAANTVGAVAVADAGRRRATALSLGLMLATFLAGIVGTLLLARSIIRQLGGEPDDAAKIVNEIAGGNLAVEVETRAGDNSSLLAAIGAMRESLVGIVANVRVSSDGIATGSAQIATGNADLSQRTEEQASNLQQTAASMEELTSTVKQNADTARQANQLATSASEAAAKGGLVVGQVVTTMEAITTSSKKISDIIGVIDSIAFQTNILALNAAVEAARAGEQGRGFAVVASEVRNLAQRSASAAKEIKDLIGDSVEKVQTGSRLVNDAGNSMDDIVNQVRRVTDLIAEISSASVEQTRGISQVGDAVQQLDQATQQNAALVEESAAAADSLKRQAAKLAEIVSVFRLAAGAGHVAPATTAPKSASPAAHAAAERRGPNRATNVARPQFAARKPAAKALVAAPVKAVEVASVKTGTDDWESL